MKAILAAMSAAVLLLACGSQPATPPAAVEVPPQAESLVKPVYPEEARRAGMLGTTIVEVTVGADGAVLACSLATSSASSALDEAALDAARSSKFTPGTRDGKPVVMKVKVPFEFRLVEEHSELRGDAQDVRSWGGRYELVMPAMEV
ncbi:TonB family protein [candidate division WOR-3 bacterium]|nr:TonB family protein [candidate division WOR-3 bacterium]